jgi:glutamate racemase
MSDPRSIGIFDSGFGGLTVMRAIRTLLPHENIIYFGDTARVPYGTKSGETILRYSIENASLLIELGIKVLVVACHTACCYSLENLQNMFSIPVLGMIAPSVEKIIRTSSQGKIGILGTRATISSGTYQNHIAQKLPGAHIIAIPCPLFVPLVEEGFLDHPLTQMTIQEYLRPLKEKNVDTLLLGSTHFPLLAPYIQHELGPDVTLVDPGLTCAEALKDLLDEKNLLNLDTSLPHYQFIVSDDPEKFRLHGKSFLNYPIEHIYQKNT